MQVNTSMPRESCAAQCSSPPRRTPPHRRRAAADPTCDIARLAASLRIAASHISQLQRLLQHHTRKHHQGEHSNHSRTRRQEAQPPTPPPTSGTADPSPNARQRRSARRAAQWWQHKKKSNFLGFFSPSPIPSTTDEEQPRAHPASNISSIGANYTTAVERSRPQTVPVVRETPAPAVPTQLQPAQQLLPSEPAQPAAVPVTAHPHAPTAIAPEPSEPADRRPAFTGDGKRQAIESPPTPPLPILTTIVTLAAADPPPNHAGRSHPRRSRRLPRARSAPY